MRPGGRSSEAFADLDCFDGVPCGSARVPGRRAIGGRCGWRSDTSRASPCPMRDRHRGATQEIGFVIDQRRQNIGQCPVGKSLQTLQAHQRVYWSQVLRRSGGIDEQLCRQVAVGPEGGNLLWRRR